MLLDIAIGVCLGCKPNELLIDVGAASGVDDGRATVGLEPPNVRSDGLSVDPLGGNIRGAVGEVGIGD